MRKIDSSGKALWSVSFSDRADARSRPNGFSTTTRAFVDTPPCWRRSTTVGNMLGGIAR